MFYAFYMGISIVTNLLPAFTLVSEKVKIRQKYKVVWIFIRETRYVNENELLREQHESNQHCNKIQR